MDNIPPDSHRCAQASSSHTCIQHPLSARLCAGGWQWGHKNKNPVPDLQELSVVGSRGQDEPHAPVNYKPLTEGASEEGGEVRVGFMGVVAFTLTLKDKFRDQYECWEESAPRVMWTNGQTEV